MTKEKYPFWEKFFSMFYEKGSEWWSSMRFSFIFMMIISNLCVWLTWVVLCAISGTMIGIPETVIGLYAIANGIGVAGKVKQKGKENGNGSISLEEIKNLIKKEN